KLRAPSAFNSKYLTPLRSEKSMQLSPRLPTRALARSSSLPTDSSPAAAYNLPLRQNAEEFATRNINRLLMRSIRNLEMATGTSGPLELRASSACDDAYLLR